MSTRCPQCGGPVVEIIIGSGDSELTMRSCSTCDARHWANDGEPVELDEVLDELNATGVKNRHRRSF